MDAAELENRRTQVRTGGCAAPSPRGTVCGRTAAHPDHHADGTGYHWASDDRALVPDLGPNAGGIRVDYVLLADGPAAGHTRAVPNPAPPIITAVVECGRRGEPGHPDHPAGAQVYVPALVDGHPSRDDQGRRVYIAHGKPTAL